MAVMNIGISELTSTIFYALLAFAALWLVLKAVDKFTPAHNLIICVVVVVVGTLLFD